MRTLFIEDPKEISEIIESCDVCFVALNEADGSPYAIPMNFAYVDGVIILHSGPHAKHLELLQKDNRVCISFVTENNKLMYQHIDVACSYSMTSKSALCKGKVEFIDHPDEKYRYINLFMKKYTGREFKISDPAIRNLRVWIVRPTEITAKAFGQNFRDRNNVFIHDKNISE